MSTARRTILATPPLSAGSDQRRGRSACHLAAHANSCVCFVLERRGGTRTRTAVLNQLNATDRAAPDDVRRRLASVSKRRLVETAGRLRLQYDERVLHRIAHRIHTLTAEIDEIDRPCAWSACAGSSTTGSLAPSSHIQISRLSDWWSIERSHTQRHQERCLIGGRHGRDYLTCHSARRRAGGLR